MNKEPLPCIDCISYAICKSIFDEQVNIINKTYSINVLCRRCKLLDDWLDNILWVTVTEKNTYMYCPVNLILEDYKYMIEDKSYINYTIKKVLNQCIRLHDFYFIALNYYCNFQDYYRRMNKNEIEIYLSLRYKYKHDYNLFR